MDLNIYIDTAAIARKTKSEFFYPFIKYLSTNKVIDISKQMAALAVTDGKFESFFNL